jgi:hypothetical protein
MDKVTAGAKLPECTACPDLSGSASQLTSACVMLGVVFYPQPSFSLFMSKSFGTGMVLIKLIQSISSCFIEKP